MDAVYVEEMPVRELKEVITAAGLSYADCLEKSDLRARAQEAMVFLRQMSGPARVLQRERARRAHGGAAAAPASFRGAASSLSESESEAEAPRSRPPPARPRAPAEAPAASPAGITADPLSLFSSYALRSLRSWLGSWCRSCIFWCAPGAG